MLQPPCGPALLEQANSILQGQATNLTPAYSHLHHKVLPLLRSPLRKLVPVRVFNPDCKKQYNTLLLRDIAKESVS